MKLLKLSLVLIGCLLGTATKAQIPYPTLVGISPIVVANGQISCPTCASGSGFVSSVSNSDSTLTISPTAGAVVASLNLANQNIWTAPIYIRPATGAYGFNIGQTFSGTTSGQIGNLINITADTANIGNNLGDYEFIQAVFGGSTMFGGRQGEQILLSQTAASSPSSSDNPYRFYVALAPTITSNSGDNGTSGGYLGNYFAMNPVCHLTSGAMYAAECAGMEVDVGVDSGASVGYRWGIEVDSIAGSQAGVASDAAFDLRAVEPNGFNNGFLVNNLQGAGHYPINVGGVAFECGSDSDVAINSCFDASGVTNAFAEAAIVLPANNGGIWWGSAGGGGEIISTTASGAPTLSLASGGLINTGYESINGTTLPTQASGTVGLSGITATPTVVAGAADIYSTLAGGLHLIGDGTSDDISLVNSGKTISLELIHGTQTVSFPGTVAATSTVTGTIVDAGGLGVAGAEWLGGTLNAAGLASAGTATAALCITSTGSVFSDTSLTICGLSSSERFKHDIHPLTEDAEAEVAMLQPVTFMRNRPESGIGANDPLYTTPEIGFKAEDICKVDKRLCVYEADGVTPRTYRPEEVTALLVGAFKELKNEVAELRKH